MLGVVAGYTYRDRFSRLLVDTAALERTEPDIAEDIFRAEIADILRPETGLEAVTQPSEVYAFTGRVQAITADSITVAEPDGAIDFILTADTSYVALETFTNTDGLPDSQQTPLTYTDIKLDDFVSVYTVEDIKTAPERHVHTVQKLN